MLRPFLSLVVAGAATTAGASLALSAAMRHRTLLARLDSDAIVDTVFLLGAGLLGVAAASLAIHWLGAFVVGAIHVVIGGFAVLLPPGGLLSGAYSPIVEITAMLGGIHRDFGDGALVFTFSGTQLVLGVFLVAAALAVRSRTDSPRPPGPVATTITIVGAGALVGALALLGTLGDAFTALLVSRFQYDVVFALGLGLAAGLAGIGGLALRWRSAGGILVGAATLVTGLVAFLGSTAFPAVLRSTFLAHGFAVVLGLTVLVAAAVAAVLHGSAVPEDDDDL